MTLGEMPAEHAILGLLQLDGGRGYGYELARGFAAERPLGLVIRRDNSMRFHHLKNWSEAAGSPPYRNGRRPTHRARFTD
ncbi:MAG: hypothetical protein ACJ789_02220 [Thermomicrobiales bacterium]